MTRVWSATVCEMTAFATSLLAIMAFSWSTRLGLDTAEESNQHGHEIIEAARAGLREQTDEQRVSARRDIFAQFRCRQTPGLLGPRFNACHWNAGEYVLRKRKLDQPVKLLDRLIEMIARRALGGAAQLREGRLGGPLGYREQLLKPRAHRVGQPLVHLREPGIRGGGVYVAGETAQRAQRRQFIVRADQCLDRAIEQIREVRSAAHDALHRLGRERRRCRAPCMNTEVATNCDLMTEACSLRVFRECRHLETRVLGQEIGNRGRNRRRHGEAPEEGKRLEQAQKPEPRLGHTAGMPHPAKLVGCRCEELTNYLFGQWIGELWIGEKRGVRFGQGSPQKWSIILAAAVDGERIAPDLMH